MKNNKKMVLGLIGVGYWGPNLLRTLNNNPSIKLKLIIEISNERQLYIKSTYPNITVSGQLSDLLQDSEIEGVVIATPVHTHFKLAKQCLQAQKHILVEKPLTASYEEGLELKKLSKKYNCLVMVGHTFLFNNAVRFIKNYLDSGECGKIRYIYSQRLNLGRIRSDVDALWNFAPHDISIIQYWMNEAAPTNVIRKGMSFIQNQIEDVSFLSLDYPDNRFANIHVSWLSPVKVREMIIVGEKKMIVYNEIAEKKVTIYDKNIDINANLGEYMDYDQKANTSFIYRSGNIVHPEFKWVEPLQQEIQHFIDCIQTKQPCLTGIDHALEVVRILDLASKKNA
jgi:predicted dehydrogenase